MIRNSTKSNKPDLREALALGALFFAYSNGLALWGVRRGYLPEALFRQLNPALVAAMLVYAASRRGGLEAVGVRNEGLRGSVLGGAGLGLALSLPPLFFFHKPFLLDTPLEYGPISQMARREMLVDVLFRVPLGIAVLEELAFRGLLQASLRRELSPGAAIVGSAAGFAAWHLTVTATSAAASNIGTAARLPLFIKPYIQPLAVLGGMLTTGIAGILFGALRERTGNLAGPIIAHWIVDGLMIAALWLKRPRRDA